MSSDTVTLKHFGLVVAEINEAEHNITLSFAPRGRMPLSDGMQEHHVTWALAVLEPLYDGYVIDCSRVSEVQNEMS